MYVGIFLISVHTDSIFNHTKPRGGDVISKRKNTLTNQRPEEKAEMANYQTWLNYNKNGAAQGGVICAL